jgi:hypothetical protein
MVKPKKQSTCDQRGQKKGYFGKIDGSNQPFTDADSRQ